MLSRLIRRTNESLRKHGLLQTCRLGGRWIASRSRWLCYEPVCKIIPEQPSLVFEREDASPRIAVQIHLFYLELLDEMIEYTNHIPYRFDCYISTDTEEKASVARRQLATASHAVRTEVQVFANRGRDVAPFLLQLAPVIDSYDYVLHLHTKYSKHDDFGNIWRRKLLQSQLASTGHVAAVLDRMETDTALGLVFQRTYWRVKPSLGWKGNEEASRAFLARMGLEESMCRNPQFPAGDMFWAKTKAVLPVFRCGLTMDDFAEEAKQVDGTSAHCIERCWGCVVASQGYTYLRVCAQRSGR